MSAEPSMTPPAAAGDAARGHPDREAIFFWIPKCAGTSIYKILVAHGCPENLWDNPLAPFVNAGLVTFGHVDVPALVAAGVIRRDYYQRALKFAFVRNPFDRMVSLFFYLRRIQCPALPTEVDFETFCRHVAKGDHPPVGLYNYSGLNQCNPMSAWLYDRDGRLLVDELGRYENLPEDFARIANQLGLPDTLPHENRGSHGPYREYYTRESRLLVTRLYQEDLDRFGYQF